MFIKINGNTVWSSTNTDGVWYSDTIDVSNNSGELTVEIGTAEDPRSDYIWTLREQENSYALVIGSSSDHKISTMPTEVYGAFKNIELV